LYTGAATTTAALAAAVGAAFTAGLAAARVAGFAAVALVVVFAAVARGAAGFFAGVVILRFSHPFFVNAPYGWRLLGELFVS
jgi:hypothetical protein